MIDFTSSLVITGPVFPACLGIVTDLPDETVGTLSLTWLSGQSESDLSSIGYNFNPVKTMSSGMSKENQWLRKKINKVA